MRMNVLRSILINAMINLPDKDLRKMFITVSNLCHGLTDRDALDSVSSAIISHLQSMTEDEKVMTLKYIHSLKDFREVTK